MQVRGKTVQYNLGLCQIDRNIFEHDETQLQLWADAYVP